jgi:hypothetical protein
LRLIEARCALPGCVGADITAIMPSKRGRSCTKIRFIQEAFHSIEIWVEEVGGGDDDDDPPSLIASIKAVPLSQWARSEHRPRIHAQFVLLLFFAPRRNLTGPFTFSIVWQRC